MDFFLHFIFVSSRENFYAETFLCGNVAKRVYGLIHF